jgi:flavodoxin
LKALIIYHSKTGHTRAAADDIARGLKEKGVEVTIQEAAKAAPTAVSGFDILLAGSPTYGNTRYKAAAKPVDRFLGSIAPMGLKGMKAGAFSVMAGYGGDKIVAAVEGKLEELGADVLSGGPAVKAGAPLSLWKGPDAGAADVERCVEFGRKLASA